MKDSEVLECAIKKLEEEGWTQGNYYHEGEGYCVVGAVAACLGGQSRPPYYPHTYVARDCLRMNGFPRHATIWQDATSRTKEEVIAALQEAVKVARAREEAEAEAETSAG